MSENIVVNVEEQLAWKLYQAGELPAARKAIFEADSLPNETPLEELEPQRAVDLQGDEVSDREAEMLEHAEAQLRRDRNALLAASDWTQLLDVPAETAEKWATYRQQLRDLPAKTKNPDKVKWPEVPNA